jgi:flagellar protein FliJ
MPRAGQAVTQLRLLRSAHEFLLRHERRQAQVLAECERQVREGELKLSELQRYYGVYQRDFGVRAEVGMTAGHARTYQTFLARIAEAVSEQQVLLERTRAQRGDEQRKWSTAASRCAALNRLLERRELSARQQAEKSAQAESDAHAQRQWVLKGARRGH